MKILICVSASIAIYKVCELVRALVKNGHEIKLILSDTASQMISPIIFEALGVEVFLKDTGKMEHITLSRWCDILLLCPATASTIGKIANGIGGSLLLDTFLAKKKSLRTIIVPAMNVEMWHNSIVQQNIKKLQQHGFQFIEPSSGVLACGEEGIGKLVSVEEIINFLFPKKNLKVLITAGGTIEKIDDVRYLTNISSGKQALEIVKAFCDCDVTLIKARVDVEFPSWCNIVSVNSANEMLELVQNQIQLGYDVFISAAAVADFSFKKREGKIKKSEIQNLELILNPDILQIVANSHNRPKCVIGFAAESENLKKNAREKLIKKKCDFMVGNELVFGEDKTRGMILSQNTEEDFNCSKQELSKKIRKKVEDFFK